MNSTVKVNDSSQNSTGFNATMNATEEERARLEKVQFDFQQWLTDHFRKTELRRQNIDIFEELDCYI